jgi:hypothetical protein
MSEFNYLCTGDGALNGHSFDCIMYSYTGAYNTYKTYSTYKKNFSTGTYTNGKICNNFNSGLTMCQQGGLDLWCNGPDDSRLNNRSCVLFESINIVIGDDVFDRMNNSLKTKTSYSRTKIYYGPVVAGYSVYSKTEENNWPNKIKSLPLNEDLFEVKGAYLIPAVEISTSTNLLSTTTIQQFNKIKRINALYYCDVKSLIKETDWKAYSEDVSLIDLSEYNKKDIYIENSDNTYSFFGDSSEGGNTHLIKGSYPDSCICGVYYLTPNSNVGTVPLNGLVFSFRRFFDLFSETEYIGILNGSKRNFTKNDLYNWNSMECEKGEFINQIEFCYNDITDLDVELLFGIFGTIETTVYDIGIKGISRIRKINYNIPGMLYNWTSNVNDIQCCSLISDEQYDLESIESYICKTDKQYVVKNDFPYSYPNDKCRTQILEPYCNSKIPNNQGEFNISNDLCSAVCGLNNTNCDAGIIEYCNSDSFTTRDDNNVKRPQVLEKLKDPICGCVFPEDRTNFQNSLSSSLLKFLDTNLISSKNDIIKNQTIRQQCTLPSCKKSSYKLFNMKNNLLSSPCNEKELCIGNGYVIPMTTENGTKVDCIRYMGGDFKCITKEEDGGFQPNLTVIPDPLKWNTCKILKNSPNTLKFEPQECQLTDTWYPKSLTDEDRERIVKNGLCYKNRAGKWKYKARKNIKIQSTPYGDPNLCPPVKRDFEGNIITDEFGVPLKEEMEEEKPCPGDPTEYIKGGIKEPEKNYNNLSYFVIGLIVFLFVIFIVVGIKKKLKKNN